MRGEPTIDIRSGRYFAAIAYVSGMARRDWLGALWRDGAGPWKITYRFRYYRDEKAHDSSDEKANYAGECTAGVTEDEVIARFKGLGLALVASCFNDTLDFIELRTADGARIVQELMKRPWAHAKELAHGSG